MRLLFIDIDGVLNTHWTFENGYCGIRPELADRLNTILKEVPDLQIVISSSWRYMILKGAMTLEGFTHLLSVCGISAWGRVHGHTEEDCPKIPDHIDCRAYLINRYIAKHKPTSWVALDDLPLPIECFVRTDPSVGLTDENVRAVVEAMERGEG